MSNATSPTTTTNRIALPLAATGKPVVMRNGVPVIVAMPPNASQYTWIYIVSAESITRNLEAMWAEEKAEWDALDSQAMSADRIDKVAEYLRSTGQASA
jgi:hypothetical protein